MKRLLASAMAVFLLCCGPAAGENPPRSSRDLDPCRKFDSLYREESRAAPSPFETEFTVGAVGKYIFVLGQYNEYSREWGNVQSHSMANMASFSDKKFCSVVHAFSSARKIDILLKDPNWLSKVFTFSASLINHNHRNTYGKIGALLSVPPDNILATKGSDMGTPFARVYTKEQESAIADDAFFKYYIGTNRPVSPLELLRMTHAETYNEMMVAGTTTNSGSVKIIGLFFKTKSGKRVVSAEIEEKLERLARELGVPVVDIEASPQKEF
ncbi:hypothetical protein KBA41_17200 [Candidatus Ozemobacteraceae bacterium]|nr:hypothetical protein [Candidatus Ozemobacteraceae bacterium]